MLWIRHYTPRAQPTQSDANYFAAVQIDEQQGDDEAVFSNLFMAIPDAAPLNDIPCGQCPVIQECADGNDVSPATCQYMAAWLAF